MLRWSEIAEAGIETVSATDFNTNELRKLDFVSGAESGAGGARADKLAWLLARLEMLPDAVLDSIFALVSGATGEMDAAGLASDSAGQQTDCQC